LAAWCLAFVGNSQDADHLRRQDDAVRPLHNLYYLHNIY